MTQLLVKIAAKFNTTLNLKTAIWATSATLDSATDDSGVALPTGRYALTIDWGTAAEEFITCTLTSTALTNIKHVTMQGVESSGTTILHRKGATVKITDFAVIKKMLDVLDWTTNFDASTPLGYDGTATISTANQFATKAYVDWVAIAGGADASTTVKGISKLSYAPASASDPIAVWDNDPRVPTTWENDALAGTSGTPSASNKYVTNDDTSATPVANKVARYSAGGQLPWLPSQAFFGDGSDGDVTISSNTSLTRDMYYDDLTIQTGFTLSTKGYRIFVKGTLNCEWTGKIASNWWAGGTGAIGVSTGVNPAGGAAWAADYTGATLPTPKVWVIGAVGGYSSNGITGTAVTLNETMTAAVAGGAGGAGSWGSPGTGWAAGSAGSNPVMRPRTYQSAYNLYDMTGSTITRHEIAPTGGSGGGGGGNGGNNIWGGGGGSGSTGWFISIFANIITNLNVEALGWAGGAGGATNIVNTGGGGGWAGWNGWFILLFYGSKTTVTATATWGSGGAGWVATAPATNSGVAGTAGNSWVVLQIQI